MLAQVSDCERNIIEAAMTERTSTRIMANSIAVPFSLFRFMAIFLPFRSSRIQYVVFGDPGHRLYAVRVVLPGEQESVEYVARRYVQQRLGLSLELVRLWILKWRLYCQRDRHVGHKREFRIQTHSDNLVRKTRSYYTICVRWICQNIAQHDHAGVYRRLRTRWCIERHLIAVEKSGRCGRARL